MAIDLLARKTFAQLVDEVSAAGAAREAITCPADAAYLVARLCEEAGVCVYPPDDLTEEEKEAGCHPDPLAGRACVAAAVYDVESGLVVTDQQGRTWRLRVSAEQLSGQPWFETTNNPLS